MTRLLAKEYSSPGSATSGMAGYSLEGQRKPRRARLKAMKIGRLVAKAQTTDAAAHEAATSHLNLKPQPSEAQQHAGNYPKGHVRIAGLDVSIENPTGSRRRQEWPPLTAHYGYILRTTGADGDHVDAFVRNGTPADYAGPVFVIDQVDPESGDFDEHKVMLGWPTAEDARRAYLSNYAPDWKGLGAIHELTLDAFKAWLADGDTTKPYRAVKKLVLLRAA